MNQQVEPAANSPSARSVTVIGLALALVSPSVIGVVLNLLPGGTRFPVAIATEWVLVIIVLAIITLGERQKLTSIGFRKTSAADLMLGFAGFVIGVLTFGVTAPLMKALGLSSTTEGIGHLLKVSISWRIAFALTAGITEEILFRGYAIERLYSLTGRLVLSAAVSFVAFSSINLLFMGIGGGIQIAVWSVLITGLYVWRRNLPACMVMHTLNNLAAFVILPLLPMK